MIACHGIGLDLRETCGAPSVSATLARQICHTFVHENEKEHVVGVGGSLRLGSLTSPSSILSIVTLNNSATSSEDKTFATTHRMFATS